MSCIETELRLFSNVMSMWPILGIIALICLVISFYLKNTAIWRGLQIGAIISTITAIIMQHDAINAAISKKIVVVCVLAGSLFELRKRLRQHKLQQ